MLPPNLDNIRQVCNLDYDELWAPMNYTLHQDIRELYYISSHGRVFSTSHNKFLFQEKTNAGYLRVHLMRKENINKPKHESVHRLVLETFNPVPNMQDLIANHIDGNKTNNYITNLEWVTASENRLHAIRNSLANWRTGEECSWSSITLETAYKIGELLAIRQYTYKEIAEMCNCNKSIVTNIANGISWREVYEKFMLWKFRKQNVSNFTQYQLSIINNFIRVNITNYIDYRSMCMDICGIIGIKINRNIYIELMDMIYKCIYT